MTRHQLTAARLADYLAAVLQDPADRDDEKALAAARRQREWARPRRTPRTGH